MDKNSEEYKNLLNKVKKFIKDNSNDEVILLNCEKDDDKKSTFFVSYFVPSSSMIKKDIEKEKECSFGEELIRILNEKKIDYVDFYQQAHISRQVFHDLISNTNKSVSEDTAFKVIFGLKLNYDEAVLLLNKAKIAISKSDNRHLIVKCFLINKTYDLFALNQVFSDLNCKVLSLN